MIENSREISDQQLLERLGPVARHLLQPDSEARRADALAELQLVLEYALCGLLRMGRSTAGFWCDGIEFQQVTSQRNGNLQCVGSAWCAKDDQWMVPICAELVIDGSQLVRIDIALGDANLDSLAQHKGRALQLPDSWLERYCIMAGSLEPLLDPLVLINQLRQWRLDHPQGRIVGLDWEYISDEAAYQIMQEQASCDHPIMLEQTWLDGAWAIRIARRS